MFVKVKFFRRSAMGYVGSEYTYETDLPLKVMDKLVERTARSLRR